MNLSEWAGDCLCLGLVEIVDMQLPQVGETWAVKFLNFLISTAKNVYLSEICCHGLLMNYPASRISCLSLIHNKKSFKSHTCEYPLAGGGGGRGLPHKKCKTHACWNSEKKPLRDTKILFCVRGLTLFHP